MHRLKLNVYTCTDVKDKVQIPYITISKHKYKVLDLVIALSNVLILETNSCVEQAATSQYDNVIKGNITLFIRL